MGSLFEYPFWGAFLRTLSGGVFLEPFSWPFRLRASAFSLVTNLICFQADREKQAAKDKEEADRLAKEAEEKRQKEKAEKIREARVRKLSAR